MAKEFYIDGIGNISVQGPVVTLTMIRETQGSNSENKKNEEIIHLTMTGQNLLKITNILNNTINRIAQRSKMVNEENNKSVETDPVTQEKKKDKTVNWLLTILCVIIIFNNEYVCISNAFFVLGYLSN